ncbi:oxidoreductase NAD-binding domain protein [Ancylostoma ceylanicum]|uniref:Oxidoreductase NAD-binding domain protein n=1 Tax=Ancylostoma ceylanicum TaxID=53326 RepID=A0A0D6M7Q5_9BILA|nr:oxidoreductase NAD-binding domain protein [Ancylostoma ceylanicum]
MGNLEKTNIGQLAQICFNLSPDLRVIPVDVVIIWSTPFNIVTNFPVSKIPDGKGLSRPYTPTRVTKTYFEIPIKIYDDGRLTRHIRDWKVGDNIEWRGPYNDNIYWDNAKISHLLLIAGGTGIAPFIRIVEDILDDDDGETRIRLVYCVRSAADVLFKDLLVEWARHWNVVVVICGTGVESPARTRNSTDANIRALRPLRPAAAPARQFRPSRGSLGARSVRHFIKKIPPYFTYLVVSNPDVVSGNVKDASQFERLSKYVYQV